MAKRTRGVRMRMAKNRASKRPGGKGRIKDRTVGRNIMRT